VARETEAIVDTARGHALPAPGHEPTLRASNRLAGVGAGIGLAAAVGIWLLSLLSFGGDLRSMSDLGLVSVLPPGVFVGAGLLVGSFCLTLWRLPTKTPLLAAHVLALILMLFGTPAVLEEVPRFTVTWRHIGLAEMVARTGTVRPDLDVYGNWPGFFIILGFLSRAAGMPSLLGLAEWASVIFNALYLAPLLLLYRALAVNPRLIWLAVWIFYSANWIAQDYLAPQAFGYLLYLTSLGLLMHAYPGTARRWGREGYVAWRRWAAPIVLILVLVAASVPVHQLTPVQLTISLAAVAVVSRGVPRALPIFLACTIAAWAVFMATAYLDGHLTNVISDVGKVGASVEEGVQERVAGSEGHLFVVRMRLALSCFIGLLAVAGCVRLLARGGTAAIDRRLIALALAPAVLPAIQSYGGEVGLRAFFFALPVLAYFAASLFQLPGSSTSSLRAMAATAAVLLVILAGFAFARYGNEKADFFTHNEVRAFEYFYDVASPTSVLAVADSNSSWRFKQYEQHEYVVANRIEGWDEAVQTGEWDGFLALLAEEIYRADASSYVIVTRSAQDAIELIGNEPGSVDAFEEALRSSDRFRIVLENRDALVATLRKRS
jgi:hypothetical protein